MLRAQHPTPRPNILQSGMLGRIGPNISKKSAALACAPPGHGAHRRCCFLIGTPNIYTTTGFGLRKNREMAGVDDLMGYIESVVFYSSLHIHHLIVHASHFPIFSRPQPGGGVYLWGPNLTCPFFVAYWGHLPLVRMMGLGLGC